MLYQFVEWQRAMLTPLSSWADMVSKAFADPANPLSFVPGASRSSAGFELLYRLGKEYEKPHFGIDHIVRDGRAIPVVQQTVLELPFCRLLRFKRYTDDHDTIVELKDDPSVLVCAPLSGHHATLLRDTVLTLLADHKVYVTDWTDARMVPLSEGRFDLSDYVRYIERFIRFIGPRKLHVISVCQPTVPVLGAISLMAARGEDTPLTMTMMGGPIDARKSPTAVNSLATQHSIEWFESNVIWTVPAHYPGIGRQVYPGFLQHTGFVAMNPQRHLASHWDYYLDLVRGDEQDAESHRRFYDEYNAVLDMAAEYYLETIRVVFQEYGLAEGTWDVDGERVRPAAIRDTALLTVEGALDDISGDGQTRAAHELCTGIPAAQKHHYTAEGAGHYGIFSGRRWRQQVYPRIRDFIAEAEQRRRAAAEAEAAEAAAEAGDGQDGDVAVAPVKSARNSTRTTRTTSAARTPRAAAKPTTKGNGS